MKLSLDGLASFLLDLLFPPRCVFCGEIVPPGVKVCRRCAEEIVPSGTVRCVKLPVSGGTVSCVCLYGYSGRVRDSILRYKFHGQKENGRYYGQLLAAQIRTVCPGRKIDSVTAVPLSPERKKERGYDQSEQIAVPLAGALGVPFAPYLRKVRENKVQHLLGREERVRNVRGAYTTDGSAVTGQNILLVDDIVTTGSTLGECADALLRGGAASVFCTSVADSEPEKS